MPAVGVTAVLLLVTLPLTLLVTSLIDAVDLVRRKDPARRWRHVRVLLVLVGLVLIEATGIVRAASEWVRAGAGRHVDRPASQARHNRLVRWWTGAHRNLFRRLAGLRLEVEGADLVRPGPVIAIGRHTSHADAALPAWLLAGDHDYRLRYVLKQDLQWSPCMDTVGNRLPHHFVDRDPADPAAELAAVRDVVAGLDTDEAAVIFPEGTFPTPDRRRRALERIHAHDPERAERLAELQVLLPPRPGGTLALLDGAPDADVLLLAHTGFERFSTIGALLRNLPFDEPVHARWWRIPRAEVPAEAAERARWLDDRWLELDAWVVGHLATPPVTAPEEGAP